ncbi:MAG: S-adenosylmethionine synthetase N-terminal domain-containing protein [Patescibacteria group bacterium]
MRLARVLLTGHPDNICDLIAAGIADEYLHRDPETRIRCNVSGGRGAIFVTGELLTQADFDVSHLIQRLLGQYGVYESMEPFIALEPVGSERVGVFKQTCVEPIIVNGYATRETDSLLPAPIHWAQKLAQVLDEKRKRDPDWFWLGASGSVSVIGVGNEVTEVAVEVEHGTQPIDQVSLAIADEFFESGWRQDAKVTVNSFGAMEKNNIEVSVGRSPSHIAAYGHGLPILVNPAGRDWHGAEIYGAWLARYIAKNILQKSDAQAVMSELFFAPGDVIPSKISIRDERGRDLSKTLEINREQIMNLLEAWKKQGIMTEVIKSGLVGNSHLPWE